MNISLFAVLLGVGVTVFLVTVFVMFVILIFQAAFMPKDLD